MRWKDLGDYLAYVAVRLLICLVQSLRLETCAWLARGLATLLTDVVRLRADVIEENLRLAFPELSDRERRRLTWRMWEHLLLMVVEIAHAPRKIHDTNWRRYIRFANLAQITRLSLLDRPKVAVSGHFGNFELGNFVLSLFGIETFSVARPLDNRFLDRFVYDFRSGPGRRILPKNGSADEVSELLARHGLLSVLADQHAGPKGCWVDFFGRPASTHKAIAVFSLAHEAPLMIGYVRRVGGPLHLELGFEAVTDPCDLPAAERDVTYLTQWFTKGLERIVRRNPEQYWWVHRRWKDTRTKRARPKAA